MLSGREGEGEGGRKTDIINVGARHLSSFGASAYGRQNGGELQGFVSLWARVISNKSNAGSLGYPICLSIPSSGGTRIRSKPLTSPHVHEAFPLQVTESKVDLFGLLQLEPYSSSDW